MDKKRHGIQLLATLLQNANFRGFFTGRIYQGGSKAVCVPGLNCYSCPGAVGACPIGSLQSFLGARTFRLPYYVLGLLLFFGALLGRAVCGFLCPFGFLQDLLHKLPFPKKLRKLPGDRHLRRLKYVVLALMLLLPLFIKITPFFCKYVCPAGTLAGILLAVQSSMVRAQLGGLFLWKALMLALVVLAALAVFRPFCRYLCPLGAIYAPFNRVALYRLRLDKESCVSCGACAAACPMEADPARDPDSGECIRCGRCTQCCPTDALSIGFGCGAK